MRWRWRGWSTDWGERKNRRKRRRSRRSGMRSGKKGSGQEVVRGGEVSGVGLVCGRLGAVALLPFASAFVLLLTFHREDDILQHSKLKCDPRKNIFVLLCLPLFYFSASLLSLCLPAGWSVFRCELMRRRQNVTSFVTLWNKDIEIQFSFLK
jgi:hypothetical protein